MNAQVEQELQDDIYFLREASGKWKLSIYQPLRWGIAGTAQIAEDVVRPSLKIPGRAQAFSRLAEQPCITNLCRPYLNERRKWSCIDQPSASRITALGSVEGPAESELIS